MTNEQISINTKRRMATSLKKFMEQKPFDKITVKEIVEDCDISRPTFYYHFEDIYALMEWMFRTEMIELLAKSENVLTWDEGILLLLDYVLDNEKVCRCAYDSVGYDVLRRMFYDSTKAMLRRFVDNLNESIHAVPEHVDFITDFYTQAFAGCLLAWIQTGMQQTPEELIALLDIAVRGDIASALRRSAESAKAC